MVGARLRAESDLDRILCRPERRLEGGDRRLGLMHEAPGSPRLQFGSHAGYVLSPDNVEQTTFPGRPLARHGPPSLQPADKHVGFGGLRRDAEADGHSARFACFDPGRCSLALAAAPTEEIQFPTRVDVRVAKGQAAPEVAGTPGEQPGASTRSWAKHTYAVEVSPACRA